jgi:hypothetical protein
MSIYHNYTYVYMHVTNLIHNFTALIDLINNHYYNDTHIHHMHTQLAVSCTPVTVYMYMYLSSPQIAHG